MSLLQRARRGYHGALLQGGVLRMTAKGVATNADKDSDTSVAIARGIYDQLQTKARVGERLAGQIAGSKFEQITRAFVKETFSALEAIRPGKWIFDPARRDISELEQYRHLAELSQLADRNPEVALTLGRDYIISPDVLILRKPEPDDVINSQQKLVDDKVARRASIRYRNNQLPLLHASISCKWTIRSDRAQNARSEALNLIRNRKGRTPHIVVVTGEPLPSRLASLALGTGDIDCVYHFALPELVASVRRLPRARAEEAGNLVQMMVDGRRLKDIADLPLDLAV